jgi:hypothetical protein
MVALDAGAVLKTAAGADAKRIEDCTLTACGEIQGSATAAVCPTWSATPATCTSAWPP